MGTTTNDYAVVQSVLAQAAMGTPITAYQASSAMEALSRLVHDEGRAGARRHDAGAYVSGDAKPSPVVERTYLRLVALERWRSERPMLLGSLCAGLVYWVVVVWRDQRRMRRRRVRVWVTNAMWVVSLAITARRWLVPPRDLHA